LIAAAATVASCGSSSSNHASGGDGGNHDGTTGGTPSGDAANDTGMGGSADSPYDVGAVGPDSSADSSGIDAPIDAWRGDAAYDAPYDAGAGSADSSPESSGGAACTVNLDAGSCVSIPSSGPAYESPATGCVTGPDLNAVLCPGGALARFESAGAVYDTAPYFLILDFNVGSGSAGDFSFLTPVGGSGGELTVTLGVGSLIPGTYTSPGGQDCGGVAFTYGVPSSAGCDGGTACTTTAVSYTAQGSDDCIGDSQTAQGSWTLVLTSITAFDAGSGGGITYYTPHGTFTTTMIPYGAVDAGAATATLSVSF